MRRRYQLIGACAMAAVIAASFGNCASPRGIRREIDPFVLNPDGAHHIYVATEDSPWKRAVITDLASRLGADYRVAVDNLQTLGSIDVAAWDVVVVLSAFYAFGLQSDTARFLKDVQAKDRVILVVTSNISDPGDYGVNTVSAASQGSTPESAKALTPARPPDEVAAEIAKIIIAKTH